MKVGICHHLSLSYYAGGEKFSIDLAKSLTQLGFHTKIYCLPFWGKKTAETDRLLRGVDYEEKWRNTVDADIAYFLYAPLVSKLFKWTCPKIASPHAMELAPELQHESALPANPLEFYRIHGLLPTAAYYGRFLMKYELNDFDAVHLINPNMHVTHRRIFSIPLWVDTDRYRPTCEKNERFTVLFVGRRSWRKGSDIFLKTAELTKKRDPDVQFVSAGTGAEGLQKGLVDDAGFRNGRGLTDIYSRAHVVVAPSRIDMCSLVILEALACGTPVITTDIPAHRFPNLKLFHASTMHDIVRNVLFLKHLHDSNLHEYLELSKRARQNVEEFFSAKVLLPRFKDMLVAVYRGDFFPSHQPPDYRASKLDFEEDSMSIQPIRCDPQHQR